MPPEEEVRAIKDAAKQRMADRCGEAGDIVHLSPEDVKRIAVLEQWPEKKTAYFLAEGAQVP